MTPKLVILGLTITAFGLVFAAYPMELRSFGSARSFEENLERAAQTQRGVAYLVAIFCLTIGAIAVLVGLLQ
jgi:uncharacterized membrane protein